jgi:two-component system, chemotaxis family, CheB/CheR fusion protein
VKESLPFFQRVFLIVLISGTFISFSLYFLIIALLNTRDEKKIAEQTSLELKINDEKIKNLLSEKEMLLKEVHHRIKNNMNIIRSILSMQSSKMENPEVDTVFQDAIARIESMEILYDKLYRSENYEYISIREYLTQLMNEIVEMFPERQKIVIESKIDDFEIASKPIFSLGLIINELITNAMKYAFTGREDGLLRISVRNTDNHVVLVFEDNGIGIAELDKEQEKGFGMTLIEILVDQINGSYIIENTGGTKYIIEFDLV